MHFLLIIAFFGMILRFISMKDTMTSIDDIGWVALALLEDHALAAASKVSTIFTYAPLQFFLGYPLYHGASDWNELIWKTRFLSFFLGCLGIGIIGLVYNQMMPLKKILSYTILFPFMLIILNYRGIIEAGQAYNYASVIPSVALLALVVRKLFIDGGDAKQNWRIYFLYAVISSILIWFSYQLLFFVFINTAYLVYHLLLLRRNSLELSVPNAKYIASRVLILIIVFISAFTLYNSFLLHNLESNRSVTGWALQDIPNYENFKGLETISYLTKYIFDLYLKLFSYSFCLFLPNDFPYLVKPFGIVLGCIAISPIFFGSKIYKRNKYFKHLINLHLFFLVASLLLNLAQKIPMGSTRHSYIYQFSLSLFILNGMYSILDFAKEKLEPINIKYAFYSLMWIVFFAYCSQISSLNVSTKEQYDLQKLHDLAKKYNAKFIIEDEATVSALISFQLNKKPLDHLSGVKVLQIPLTKDQIKNLSFPVIVSSHIQNCNHCLAYLGNHRERMNLISVPPQGSTELVGNINGGNGFFVMLVR
jgi:branched-subunit amino acid transport protein